MRELTLGFSKCNKPQTPAAIQAGVNPSFHLLSFGPRQETPGFCVPSLEFPLCLGPLCTDPSSGPTWLILAGPRTKLSSPSAGS